MRSIWNVARPDGVEPMEVQLYAFGVKLAQ
jgi:hypothetical protein